MTYKKNANYGGTLAALQAAQLALEKQLQENCRSAATRVIRDIAARNQWPEGDAEEVLGALGLEP